MLIREEERTREVEIKEKTNVFIFGVISVLR
jgi:hypothetical protein